MNQQKIEIERRGDEFVLRTEKGYLVFQKAKCSKCGALFYGEVGGDCDNCKEKGSLIKG